MAAEAMAEEAGPALPPGGQHGPAFVRGTLHYSELPAALNGRVKQGKLPNHRSPRERVQIWNARNGRRPRADAGGHEALRLWNAGFELFATGSPISEFYQPAPAVAPAAAAAAPAAAAVAGEPEPAPELAVAAASTAFPKGSKNPVDMRRYLAVVERQVRAVLAAASAP